MYPEERKVGNQFEVDISIVCPSPVETITSIDQTVNYVDVYSITQDVFSTHSYLLESCAMNIAEKLSERYPLIEELTISIRKLNPPITNFSGSVGVTYSRKFI